MTSYLIYRHGSNSANQSMTPKAAIAIVEAANGEEAKRIASENHTVYNNQYLEAVPESKANKSDWNATEEETMRSQFGGNSW
jgi:hypothetical protein